MNTTIPRETVLQIVQMFRELQALEARRAGMLAEMIRSCISTLQCDAGSSPKVRRAEGFVARAEAGREHREDQKRAWLYLQFVATQLENMSVRTDDQSEDQNDVHGR